MRYNIPAIAINYKGHTFRSKLEAMVYDYLLAKFPPNRGFEIEYEPKIYRSLWNIDFAITHKGSVIHICEVKPESRMFDLMKYLITSCQMDSEPSVLCVYYEYMVEFVHDGGFTIIPHDQKLWMQSFNNVKFYGSR